jgi:integrase
MRVTIGDVSAWSIAKAQAEARRLQVLIDQGHDPRQVEADREAANKAKAAAQERQQQRETITLGMAWEEYLAARKPQWSERHYQDHVADMHPGGEKRIRSKVPLTIPGPLASLAAARLVDVTPELVEEWAQAQSAQRPTRARLSLRLLKAFLFWCSRHPTYKAIVTDNAAQSKTARESLGKPSVKNDALQREQLGAWFAAVKQIDNPVTSAYLQALLLIGARRNELATLRWEDVDFQWNSLTIRDKVEGTRIIPLTPYVGHLLSVLPRRNGLGIQQPYGSVWKACRPSYSA